MKINFGCQNFIIQEVPALDRKMGEKNRPDVKWRGIENLLVHLHFCQRIARSLFLRSVIRYQSKSHFENEYHNQLFSSKFQYS